MSRLLFYLSIIMLPFRLFSQTEQYAPVTDDIFSVLSEDSTSTVVELFQPSELHLLVDKNVRMNKRHGLSGYRIQIYSGSGTQARAEATENSNKFVEAFPDFDRELIYFNYQAPYFKVCVGDYRNRNEAIGLYHRIKEVFPGAYIVKTRINYPKLVVDTVDIQQLN